MRKKDYDLIAKSLHQTFTFYFDGKQKQAVKTAMLDMADNLEAYNPKFDRQKFLILCGTDYAGSDNEGWAGKQLV